MTTPLIDVQRPSAFVARVFLNRPDVRNAFNEDFNRNVQVAPVE